MRTGCLDIFFSGGSFFSASRTGSPGTKVDPYGVGLPAERGGADRGRSRRAAENAGTERLGGARGQEGEVSVWLAFVP